MSNPAPGNAPPLRILTIGTGAVGGFYSAQLARAGADVSLLCRSDYEVVARQGLLIRHGQESFQFKPTRVIRQADAYPGQPDILFIALKALPEIATADLIAPAVGPNTVLFLLQNGIGVEEPLVRAFPDNPCLSGLAFTCLNRTAPGEIRHLDYGRLVIGCYPRGESAVAHALAALFQSAGVPCRVTAQVVAERWRKLVWNAPYNPLSVLGKATTREIMEQPESARLARQVMMEVVAIAAAEGYPMALTVVERNLQETLKMAPYRTSMLLDYLAGRPLETEAILGVPLALARRHGIEAPCMTTLHALLRLATRPPTPSEEV